MDSDAIASPSLWPGGFPASQFLRPDASGPRQMTAGSGQRLAQLSRSPSPLGCVLRTLITSPLWYSTLYRLTWRPMGTKSGRLWFRLAPSARPMSASGSSSWPIGAWPTPAACNPNDGETLESFAARREALRVKHHNGNGVGTPLGMAVKMQAWPIATNARNGGTLMANGTRYPGRASAGLTLTDQTERPPAASWPTPVARDHKGEGRPGQLGNLGKLNPAFVESLMGFPLNWTDIPGPPSKAKRNTTGKRLGRSRASAPTAPPA